jgi:hypothetical protein
MCALFVLLAGALDTLRVRLARRGAWLGTLAVLPAALVVFSPWAQMREQFVGSRDYWRLLLMGRYLREALPGNAVIFTFAHGGALSMYTGRPIVRLDRIGPGQLDTIAGDLRNGGYEPVFVLDIAAEPSWLREKFAMSRFVRLDWPARAEFITSVSVLYHRAYDRDAFLSGDRWAIDRLRDPQRARPQPPQPLRAPGEVHPFPPLDDLWMFKTALEATYRGALGRPPIALPVSSRTSVVWLQRYLRYRVHGCAHGEAVSRVFQQLEGRGPQPLCASPATLQFPPRDETVAFRRVLDTSPYARARASPLSSVDAEGDAVWVQEYLTQRLSGCAHGDATEAVLNQILQRGEPRCRLREAR